MQKQLCHFFLCRGTKKELVVGIFYALETLTISPHLSFGGQWDGMKSYNTIVGMRSHSLEELEKLCKVSQECSALTGLRRPSHLLAGTDIASGGCGNPADLTALAFQLLYHSVHEWPWKLAKSPCITTVLFLKTKIKAEAESLSVLWGQLKSHWGSRVVIWGVLLFTSM